MASGVTIRANPALTPARVSETFMKAAERQVRKAILYVEGDVRQVTPVRSGHLRRSITSTVRRQGNVITAMVGTNLPYAMYLEEGTGVYGPRHRKIVAKHTRTTKSGKEVRGALRWSTGRGAQYMFRASVKGIKPTHFFTLGVERGKVHWEQQIGLIGKVARRDLGMAG